LVPFSFLYSRFLKKKYGSFITNLNGKYSILQNKKEFAKQSWVHKFFYSAAMIFSLIGGVFGTLMLALMFLCSF